MGEELQRVQFVPWQVLDAGGKTVVENQLSDAENQYEERHYWTGHSLQKATGDAVVDPNVMNCDIFWTEPHHDTWAACLSAPLQKKAEMLSNNKII